MKKINYEANLMCLRTGRLGITYPYGGMIPTLLMVLSAIKIKQALQYELGGE